MQPSATAQSQHAARVFISYSHSDIKVAEAVEKQLRAEGFDVYRDATRIRHMTHWTKELAKELSERDVVVLLWSDAAAQSEWVRSEWMTARALELGIVVCLLDPAEQLRPESALPADLGEYQYILLGRDEGEGLDRGIGKIVALLREPERIPRKWTYTAPPENFFVPFPVNPNFVGRKDLMLDLYLLFLGNLGPVGINQTAVAFGMGGIGKTQLAAEFCWRYSFAFEHGVLWINAARGLITEFCQAAYRLGLSVDRPDSPDATQRLLAALQGHISRNPKMLLVLDNLPDPADVNREVVPGFRPSALNCSLLVTTRRQDLPRGMNPVRVDVLPLHDAMALLTRDFPPGDETEQASARVICKRLGGLPLAVEMVAAYLLNERGAVSYYRYQLNLDKRIRTIEELKDDRPLATRDPALLAVFQEQYESVKSEDARLLFQISGQMNEAEQVPRRRLELFSGLSDKGPGVKPRFSSALNELIVRSLVEELKDGQTRLHPLVWEYASGLTGVSEAKQLRSACADRASRALPDIIAVEAEYRLREMDIDALLNDLSIAAFWASVPETGRRLSSLLRPLDRERHNLRPEEKAAAEGRFFQRVGYRAARMGLEQVLRDCSSRDESVLVPLHSRIADDPAAVRTFKGHMSGVNAVAYSSDGRYALSGSADETLMLWDVATGEGVRTFKGHTHWVTAVAFSPDGRYALSGSNDNTLMLWDIATGEPVRTFKGHTHWVNAVAFSPDGRYALSGSHDKTLMLWDIATGEPVRTFKGHTHWVNAVAFSPDGRYALSGSMGRTLMLWDIATGEPVRTFKGHTSEVRAVAFSPDGRYALSGSWDATLMRWDIATGEPVRTFKGHSESVLAVAFSPDGRYALSGASDKTLILWDIATGETVRTFKGHTDKVTAVAYSPDGRYALSASWDDTLMLWDVATGEFVRAFKGHTRPVSAVAFSPDGRYALSASWDDTLELWDIATGGVVRTFKGHTDKVTAVAFSPDGRYALSGSRDTTLMLWDIATGGVVRTFKGHTDYVKAVAFSPDGRYALSGSKDATLMRWDIATGEPVRTFKGHKLAVNAVAFSPDGRYALSESWDETLMLRDIATAEVLSSLAVAAQVHSIDWRGDKVVVGLENGDVEFFRIRPPRSSPAAPSSPAKDTR